MFFSYFPLRRDGFYSLIYLFLSSLVYHLCILRSNFDKIVWNLRLAARERIFDIEKKISLKMFHTQLTEETPIFNIRAFGVVWPGMLAIRGKRITEQKIRPSAKSQIWAPYKNENNVRKWMPKTFQNFHLAPTMKLLHLECWKKFMNRFCFVYWIKYFQTDKFYRSFASSER